MTVDVHVEEVELAITRSLAIEPSAWIARLVLKKLPIAARFEIAPRDEMQVVLPSDAHHELGRRTRDRFRDRGMLRAPPEIREELGQYRELGAPRRRVDQQTLGR